MSHDTKILNNCVFGYGTKIAGDCEIGNGVIFSSSVIQNAGTRVGDVAMIQAGTRQSRNPVHREILAKHKRYNRKEFLTEFSFNASSSQ